MAEATKTRHHHGGPSYPIPVWNGILDHRSAIGPAIWTFLWCIDRVTKEESGTGYVLNGKVVTAGRIAEELTDCERTVRRHLERLASLGYITLGRSPYGFAITVANSRKFGIWRADKNVHSADSGERTKMSARPDKSVQCDRTEVSDLMDKSVRPNKETQQLTQQLTQQGPTALTESLTTSKLSRRERERRSRYTEARKLNRRDLNRFPWEAWEEPLTKAELSRLQRPVWTKPVATEVMQPTIAVAN